jgi:outer membrane protein OmpA-like peptidoglycan-associated protein
MQGFASLAAHTEIDSTRARRRTRMAGMLMGLFVALGLPRVSAAQVIVLPPSPHDIGSSDVGITLPTSFIIENAAGAAADLNVTAIAPRNLQGETCAAFAITTALPVTVPPAGTRQINVDFTPTVGGELRCTFRFTSNDTIPGQDELRLTGTGRAPEINVVPTAIDFGAQVRGVTSAATIVTIQNEGAAPLAIMNITLAGTHPGDFSFTPATAPPFTIPAGGTRTVDVRFTPTALGARSARLEIESNDADEATVAVALSGTGVEPDINVAPTSIDFGTVAVGTTSAPQSITVHNTGGAELSITNIQRTGGNTTDFAFTPTTFPITVPAGGQATISVTFTPSAAGLRSTILRISSNDPDENPVDVALSGTGGVPDIDVVPTSLNFGEVRVGTTSAPRAVTVHNTGGAPLSITGITLVGGQANNFAFTPNTFPITVPAGGQTTISVTFTPSATGTRSTTMRISSNDPDENPVSVALSGTGVVPDINVVPTSLNFGIVRVGTTSAAQTITVENTGSGALTITNIELTGGNTGDFAFTPTTFPITVAAGSSTPISVTFTPAAAGLRSTTLRISNDDPDENPVDVALSGTGERPIIAVDPLSINFGSIPQGQSSPASVVTATNNGNISLIISSVSLSNTADFRFNGSTSVTVPAGGSTTWDVFCTPSTTGTRTGNFTITSDDPSSPTVNVALSCEGISSPISLNPAATFPDTYINDTSAITIRVRNDSSVSVTVNSITPSLSVFRVTSPTTSFTLPGRNSFYDITLEFTPVANQLYSGTLTFDTSQGIYNFPISGRGVEAILDVNPLSHDFGVVEVLSSSAPRTFTVRNTGTASFTVSGVSVSNTADFTLVPPSGLPVTLAPGASTTFSVTAHPQTGGVRTGVITVQTNIRGSTTATFNVQVTGAVADIMLSQNSIDFGAVDLQDPNLLRTRTLTVTNTGTLLLAITSIAVTGEPAYSLALGQNTSATILPGNTFDITVQYAPTVESASDNATLGIVSNAYGETLIEVPITGRGVDRHLALSTMTLNFPETYRNPADPPTQTLTIHNMGGAPLAISMIVAGGPGAEAYAVQGPSTLTVAPQGSADVVVAFAPPAANPDYTATLTIINDDDANPMAQVTLAGAGVLPNVALTPATMIELRAGVGVPVRLSELLDANQLRLINMDATDSFTVAQVRVADMAGNPMMTGPFRVVGLAPDTELAPMQAMNIDVEFMAEQAGTFEAVVEVYLGEDPVRVTWVIVRGVAYDVELRGGGCAIAGSGHTGGGALWLLLCGLALVMVRRRMRRAAGAGFLAALVGLGLLAAMASMAAQARADSARNLDLSTFRPAPGVESGMLSVESADVGVAGAWALGLSLDRATNPLMVHAPSEGMSEAPISARTATELMFSYAFAGRFEAGVLLPILQQSGDEPVFSGIKPPEGTALGDLALHAKAALLRSAGFRLATSALVTLPTASDGKFAGLNGPGVHARGIAGVSLSRINLALNAGLWVRGANKLADAEQGNALTYGLATELRVARSLSAVGELFGTRGLTGDEPAAASPLEAALGVRYRPTRTVSVGSGVGRGLVAGIGAPDFRAFLLISFSPRAREIPLLAPPRGPVDLGDDDSDGVINSLDKCPDEPEDLDGFQDSDGCPDLDNDGDGIADSIDECPDEAEDRDGFQDNDGCPDLDNDGDGILDKDDKCPNDAETMNGFEDDDGCPDKGASLVMVMPDRIDLFEPIRFRGESARLGDASEGVLKQVAATLRAQSDIRKLRIAVHVHPGGKSDQRRSEERAQVIKEFLVKLGVEPERLEAKGYGASKPLVSRSQRGAQDVNDRVELVIVDKRTRRR